jgi:hypothetical protein
LTAGSQAADGAGFELFASRSKKQIPIILFKTAASKLEASPDDLEIVDKQIRVKGTPTKSIPLATVATDAHNVIGEVIGRGTATTWHWWPKKKPTAAPSRSRPTPASSK